MLRRGSHPGFLSRGSYGEGDLPESRRPSLLAGLIAPPQGRAARPAGAAMRVLPGPRHDAHPTWVLLCLAPAPILLTWSGAQHMLMSAASSLPGNPAKLLWSLWTLAAAPLLGLPQRLARLLYEPEGETVELALLPGLGSPQVQRRALLQQALVRPLLGYWLGLGGVVCSYWALLHVAGMPTWTSLSFAVLGVTLLLLFAALTLGVLSGGMGPSNDWVKGWALLALLPAAPGPSPDPVPGGVTTSERLTWLVALCLPVLAGPAAYVIVRALSLRRRPRLLCL